MKETLKTEENQSVSKVDTVEAVRKELEEIKRRRELEKEKSIEIFREQSMLAEKK